jgi:hypothetical protein
LDADGVSSALGIGGISWIEKPALRSPIEFFLTTIARPPATSGWPLTAVLTGQALAGIPRLIGSGCVWREDVPFAAVALVSPFVAFVLSYLLGASIWVPRQLIISAFAFIIIIAILADALSALARQRVAAAIIVWAFVGSAYGFTRNRVPHYADIFADIQRNETRAVMLGEENWILWYLLFYGPAAHASVFNPRTAILVFLAPSNIKFVG